MRHNVLLQTRRLVGTLTSGHQQIPRCSQHLVSSAGNMRMAERSVTNIPYVVEGVGAEERVYDIYSRLLKDRIICLMGQVDDRLCAAVTAQLLFLQSQSEAKPIFMYINSPGGSVTSGLAIYDTMQYVSCPISTLCIGQASSMGSLLLAAGTAGARIALPNSRIMVHQPSGQAAGQASDIKIHAEEILKVRSILNNIMATHTGQSLETIESVMERDRFMTPEEAKEFGIIDKVVKASRS